jgi:protein SCO1/2
MTRFYAIAGSVAVVAVLGVSAWIAFGTGNDDVFAECRASQVAGGAGSIGGPFQLVDETGATVTDSDVFTRPSLVYFGYTFCPDVCPLDNARNAEAVDILEERGIEVTPVFISIDPERDTPEVLRDFTENLHPRMIGLTGSPEQIRAASQAYKTYFKKQDGDPEFYLMDHSTFTYLVLPKTGFVEFFRREETPDEMAAKVACFVEKAGSI